MQRKIRLMIGILIMTGLIAGCWKVSKNLQKELKEEMETIGEAEKSDRIVVLDAGHGGTDSGKVGINGVKEKDINLTITNSVKKILEKENIQVIMTRETDKQLAQSKVEDLKYRVKIMNRLLYWRSVYIRTVIMKKMFSVRRSSTIRHRRKEKKLRG